MVGQLAEELTKAWQHDRHHGLSKPRGIERTSMSLLIRNNAALAPAFPLGYVAGTVIAILILAAPRA